MITRISVKNFKSLADFEMSELPRFVCLIGLNGSGKTTVLQFFDFLKSIMEGRVRSWLDRMGWEANELTTFGSSKFIIDIEVEAELNGIRSRWIAKFNVREGRCTSERLEEGDASYVFDSGILQFDGEKQTTTDFRFEGSIFSIRSKKPLLVQYLQNLHLFGVLDPQAIAQPTQMNLTKKAMVEVGSDGKNLSGFIARLPPERQEKLLQDLALFYPVLRQITVKRQRFGWNSLLLKELESATFKASHLSYGTLRLFVILSQQFSGYGTLAFDEIENGFNQELFSKLVDILQNYGNGTKQVFVSTHSGLLLNYLPDDTARKCVYFLFKDRSGHTLARHFFRIQKIADKLNVLGPGSAMGDTDLDQLSVELARS